MNLCMQAVPFLSLTTSVFNCQIYSVYFHIFLTLKDKNFLSELFSFLMICLTVNKLRKCQTTQPIFSANLAFFTNICSYNLLLVETITKQSYDNIQIKARKSKPKEEFENKESRPKGSIIDQVGRYLGVVHKLRLRQEVGRQSKNVNFYKVETVNEGGQVVNKKQKTCHRSL